MKTILITSEDDRPFTFHKDDPDINHFPNIIIQKVEMADDWIHITPVRVILMKSRYRSSLSEIRELLVVLTKVEGDL